jgi:hypothetical protein
MGTASGNYATINPRRKFWELYTYAIMPVIIEIGGMMSLPSSSFAGRMSTVARIVAIIAQRLCSARCRPEHILPKL